MAGSSPATTVWFLDFAWRVVGCVAAKTKPALPAGNAGSFHSFVMPGLVPGIHTSKRNGRGLSPAITPFSE
jgi:hypothetical protein